MALRWGDPFHGNPLILRECAGKGAGSRSGLKTAGVAWNTSAVDSRKRMSNNFQTLDVARFLSETPHKILEQIQTPVFLTQAALIVFGGLCAWWMARLARGPLVRFAAKLPRSWAATFLHRAQYIALPLHWLVILWIGALTGLALNLKLPLLDAAIDLVTAWIVIRLVSFSVKSHAMSVAIAVAAFLIAALSILDLYHPLVNWLGRVEVYNTKQTHITLLVAIHALIVLGILLWLTRFLYRFLQRRIEQAPALTPSLQVLLSQLLKIFLPAVAVMIALQTVGVDLTTLTVAFGAVGLGIGLGLQKAVSNLVSGLTLIISKSIKPGDILKYKDTYGWVTNMSARYVTVRTLGGIEHLIPNDYFIENGVENWSYSDASVSLSLSVGISYDDDPHRALQLCREAAASISRVMRTPAPTAVIKEFGDSAININVFFWIDDPRLGTSNVRSEVYLAIWDRFKAAGISIPYPQRDVRIVSEKVQ
jgi:small-conductance mechanosensitive channel